MTQEFLGMPVQQHNAVLPRSLMVRVGLPHSGGALSFHAFKQGYPVMVSAASFWDQRAGAFRIPDATNLMDLDFAIDSAGFSAMSNWKKKGKQAGMAGVYPWGLTDYCRLAALMRPSWWAVPDMCTEPEIADNQAEIDYRIDATATLLEATLRVVYSWQKQLARSTDAEVVASMVTPPVPVVQGRKIQDYRRSLELTLSVWERWRPWLAAPTLIGVGSVCRRDLHDKQSGLYAIVAALEAHLPPGTKMHLFGIKGASLSRLKLNPAVASTDSMAYDFGARVEARRSGHSNSMAHRSAAMSAWMRGAGDRLTPVAGEQPRLDFFSAHEVLP